MLSTYLDLLRSDRAWRFSLAGLILRLPMSMIGISIILLILQITSMGATFPVETAPAFFQWIHPFLPMSYTQLAFRELIAGSGAQGAVGNALAVLGIWAAIAVVVILIGARVRRGPKPLPADNALAPTAA